MFIFLSIMTDLHIKQFHVISYSYDSIATNRFLFLPMKCSCEEKEYKSEGRDQSSDSDQY